MKVATLIGVPESYIAKRASGQRVRKVCYSLLIPELATVVIMLMKMKIVIIKIMTIIVMIDAMIMLILMSILLLLLARNKD